MEKRGTLTVGIISKNGQPFIEKCLQSLSAALSSWLQYFNFIEFILVDSDSSDSTLRLMQDFSGENRTGTTRSEVYLLQGECNAAKARNVILNNCTGDMVFLCDGDIDIASSFLIVASQKIIGGQADAVIGQLEEKWFDAQFHCYNTIPVRKKIDREHFVRISGGIIFLSNNVVQSGVRYDEGLRRNEDRDFTLRVSESFNILAIPEFVGTHLTQPYYSDERFRIFYREKYNRPLGIFIRKHIWSLRNLLEIAKADKGVMVGMVYIVGFPLTLALCLLGVYVLFPLLLAFFVMDFIRYRLKKNPAQKFFVYRLLSPVMVLEGFFLKNKDVGYYSVHNVTDHD